MASKQFVARFGVDNNNQPLSNVASITSGGTLTITGDLSVTGNISASGSGETFASVAYVNQAVSDASNTSNAFATSAISELHVTIDGEISNTANATLVSAAANTAEQIVALALGSISTQSSANVEITGGHIDGVVIGDHTAANATFVNVSASTGQVTTAPSGSTDIVNKAYVDSMASGLVIHTPVVAATTADILLDGSVTTVDGVTLANGNRVLVKNQTTQSDNGFYDVNLTGAWTRSTAEDTWAELVRAYVFVLGGSVNSKSGWVCDASGSGSFGDPITFTQFSASNEYTADETTLHLTGTQFSIKTVGTATTGSASAANTTSVTTNAYGQVTAVSEQAIAIASSQVSGLGTMSAQDASSVAIKGGTVGDAGNTVSVYASSITAETMLTTGFIRSAGLATPTGSSQTTLDTISAGYSAATYDIYASVQATGEVQLSQLHVVANATSAFVTEFGVVDTAGTVATYDVSGNALSGVSLLATPTASGVTTFRWTKVQHSA